MEHTVKLHETVVREEQESKKDLLDTNVSEEKTEEVFSEQPLEDTNETKEEIKDNISSTENLENKVDDELASTNLDSTTSDDTTATIDKDDQQIKESVVGGLVICPDPLINDQLVRGLEAISDRYLNKQTSLLGPHHVDVYNALTRVFHNLNGEDFKITISNLFDYLNKYSEAHCHNNIILQSVTSSGLSVEKQKEYIKIISLLLMLKEPQGRSNKAKRINWNTFPNGLSKMNADVITNKFKLFFNLL